MAQKAILALEDGRIFEGTAFGVPGEHCGEVVFNTGMTGYQEVLTDPSYEGQIVVMTYPLIGNCGVNDEDSESRSIWLEGFVINELCRKPNNWRSVKDLESFLKEYDIMGIEGIDTRALTKHIREAGAMKAVISTIDHDTESLIAKVKASPDLVGRDLVRKVTCKKQYIVNEGYGPHIIVLDYGVKKSILEQLCLVGCRITVVPANTEIDSVMKLHPDGILLSNGPGDPAAVTYAVDTIRELLDIGTLPIFGICLGHQLVGLALGGETYKLKFGHHGENHPVKDLITGKIDITVQNHGFCVDIDSLDRNAIEITHMNLNDNTLEGMRHRELPLFSVQFHPEAGPGPHDARHLFGRFMELVKKKK
ncbi:MAG: glutamine-hydrolyzing carbamoyl-phosphate synthase small subunit [Deltaproteobacteria bacterium]|nr:glutamine-hydrolyzing carbamoyl-phosphate synthase small subunit [Deltaproteobacteria bacterium]